MTALFTAQVASAQSCIKQQDLADAVVFTMPIAYQTFSEKCAGQLAQDGFVAREGDAFAAGFSGLQDDTWPGAYSFFKSLPQKESGEDEMSDLFDNLPAEVMRPIFELIIAEKLSGEIKVQDCSKIEQIIEPLGPLPPENFGTLVARIFNLIPGKSGPEICRENAP
ncbi:MAG: hypothetical protein WAT93_03630 [Pontixanthobacter sp.]